MWVAFFSALFFGLGVFYGGRQSNESAVSSSQSASVASATGSDDDLVGYKKIGLHEVMLTDAPRMRAYRTAIVGNKELFEGKVVLDVGSGTGILSLWAAQAGAKAVASCEYHRGLAKAFEKVVKANKLENVIHVFPGPIENSLALVEERVGKVDIIVSEWMGYALLYENMLPSVLDARDKVGKEGVILLPNKARLFMVGGRDPVNSSNKRHFFEDIYSFNMSEFTEWTFREVSLAQSIPGNIMTSEQLLLEIDTENVRNSDLDFAVPFELKVKMSGTLDILTLYFDVSFTHGHEKVRLGTSPTDPQTHWVQTHLYMRKPVKLTKGQSLTGTITWKRSSKREVGIAIVTNVNGEQNTDHYAIEY